MNENSNYCDNGSKAENLRSQLEQKLWGAKVPYEQPKELYAEIERLRLFVRAMSNSSARKLDLYKFIEKAKVRIQQIAEELEELEARERADLIAEQSELSKSTLEGRWAENRPYDLD